MQRRTYRKLQVGEFVRVKVPESANANISGSTASDDKPANQAILGIVVAKWKDGSGPNEILVQRVYRSNDLPSDIQLPLNFGRGKRTDLALTNIEDVCLLRDVLDRLRVKIINENGETFISPLEDNDDESDNNAPRYECSKAIDTNTKTVTRLPHSQFIQLKRIIETAAQTASEEYLDKSETSEMQYRFASSRRSERRSSKKSKVTETDDYEDDDFTMTGTEDSNGLGYSASQNSQSPSSQGVYLARTRPSSGSTPTNGKDRSKPKISESSQAIIPDFSPQRPKPTDNKDIILWSPRTTINEQSLLRDRTKLLVNITSKQGNVVPLCIKQGNNKEIYTWVRVIRPLNEYGRLIVMPVDASWPIDISNPSSLATKDDVMEVDLNNILLPCNLEEQVLLNIHDRSKRHVVRGLNDTLKNWTEKEYNTFCIAKKCLRNITTKPIFPRISNLIGTKSTKEVIDMFWSPRVGVENLTSSTIAPRCKSCHQLCSSLLVCRRYFSCKYCVCQECFEKRPQEQGRYSAFLDGEYNSSFSPFEQAKFSRAWVCVDCQSLRLKSLTDGA